MPNLYLKKKKPKIYKVVAADDKRMQKLARQLRINRPQRKVTSFFLG